MSAGGHVIGARRGGFTLLETMVVVTIVATLASIALPSYAGYVRRTSFLRACAD